MTKGDILFLQSLVESHKRVIAADCATRHLDHSVYTRRVRTTEMCATRIIRSLGYTKNEVGPHLPQAQTVRMHILAYGCHC